MMPAGVELALWCFLRRDLMARLRDMSHMPLTEVMRVRSPISDDLVAVSRVVVIGVIVGFVIVASMRVKDWCGRSRGRGNVLLLVTV